MSVQLRADTADARLHEQLIVEAGIQRSPSPEVCLNI